MEKVSKQFLTLVLIFTGLFGALYVSDARPLELNYPPVPGLPPLTEDTPLPDLVNYIFSFLVIAGGIIAFISLVYAGFLFLLSGSNPGLRQRAKKRISDVFTGLLLLLGMFVFLNIINPDLTLLHQPGVAPDIPDKINLGKEPAALIGAGVDLENLRYGGFVFYADYTPIGVVPGYDVFISQGKTGRSETVTHSVGSFSNQTYIDTNTGNGSYNNPVPGPNAVSAVKILGAHVAPLPPQPPSNCQVTLTGGAGALTLNGPGLFNLSVMVPNLNNDVSVATPSLFNECTGYSVKIFENSGFNIPTDGGSLMLIDSHSNFKDLDFSPASTIVNDRTSSIMASIRGQPSPQPSLPFVYKTCVDKDYKGDCQTIEQNSLSVLANPYENSISSIQFLSDKDRQAGVIAYRDSNYRDKSEVFITSDPRLDQTCGPVIGGPSPGCAIIDLPNQHQSNDGNYTVEGGGNNKLDGTEIQFAALSNGISSLKIIGKYRVILYTSRDYSRTTPSLVINNAVSKPCMISDALPGEPTDMLFVTDPKSESIVVRPGMLYIKDFSDKAMFCKEYHDNNSDKGCKETFNDEIVSIKLELPMDIIKTQGLVPGSVCDNQFSGAHVVEECGEEIEFCPI